MGREGGCIFNSKSHLFQQSFEGFSMKHSVNSIRETSVFSLLLLGSPITRREWMVHSLYEIDRYRVPDLTPVENKCLGVFSLLVCRPKLFYRFLIQWIRLCLPPSLVPEPIRFIDSPSELDTVPLVLW